MSSESTDTRTRILQAAWRLLEERGAAATTLARVGQQAGVSRQAVYLHFGSRAGLLVALVDHIDRTFGLYERIAKVNAASDGVEALRLSQVLTAEYAPSIHGPAMALAHAGHADEAAAVAFADRLNGRLVGLVAIMERIAAEGRLAPGWSVQEAAEAVWALGLPEAWAHLGVERGWSVEAYRRFLVEGAEALVVAGGAVSGPAR